MTVTPNHTTDTFFNGRLTVRQNVEGYRFSIDAVLLAALPRLKPGNVVMDIGTGCGIIPLLLAFRHPGIRLVGIEVQPALARLAKRNVAENHFQDRISILNQDIRELKPAEVNSPVDWIVSNPPYRPPNSGRMNPNAERAFARHEIHLDLSGLMQSARKFLKTGGRLATIYPMTRLVDLFYEMRLAGIEPKWMQSIRSREDDDAKLALVEGMMGARPGLTAAPALVVYGSDGSYTETIQRMMAP